MNVAVRHSCVAALAILPLAWSAVADASPNGGPVPHQQVDGHPAYLRALSNLRDARANLARREGDAQLHWDERRSVEEIERAIGEIKQAAIDDGKNIDDHPPIGAGEARGGRLHRALSSLQTARDDISREDSGFGNGLRARAMQHIGDAISLTEQGIAEVDHGDSRGPQGGSQGAPPGAWSLLPGCAKTVGRGGGQTWVIGCGSNGPGGGGIFRWNGSNWDQTDGAAVDVAVTDEGIPWVINSGGQIFRRVSNTWQQLPGCAKSIGSGGGQTWVIGCGGGPSGAGIFRWNGANWDQTDGAATAVAVGSDGTPWVVNGGGQIFRRVSNTWEVLPGCAKGIGRGGGQTWVLGCSNNGAGGWAIFRWNGSNWDQTDGAAAAIAIGSDGAPWVVNAGGQIFRR
jgi:hypothetical protein